MTPAVCTMLFVDIEGFTTMCERLKDMEELASVLSMSRRTILRRLKEEQTSYQAIRDGVILPPRWKLLFLDPVESVVAVKISVLRSISMGKSAG